MPQMKLVQRECVKISAGKMHECSDDGGGGNDNDNDDEKKNESQLISKIHTQFDCSPSSSVQACFEMRKCILWLQFCKRTQTHLEQIVIVACLRARTHTAFSATMI